MSAATAFAPRYKVWPPAGYTPPTQEEFTQLCRTAERYHTGGFYQAQWERMGDDKLIRHLQLVEIWPTKGGRTERAVCDYTRGVRREMQRRGLVHKSMAILRCEACSHATERLFEVTQKTHPGLESQRGPVTSGWYCARCWSEDDVIDEAEDGDEPAEG